MTGRFAVEQYSTRAMGSALRATVVGVSRRRANRAWERLVADVERTEAALSRFRAESELSRLNASAGEGSWQVSDGRLYAMAATAARAHRRTAGHFDARVLRSLEALGEQAGVAIPSLERRAEDHTPPPDRALDCGIERRPREQALRIAEPIDSGGLGKGLALRWAARATREPASR